MTAENTRAALPGDLVARLLVPPYPSGNPWPILERLDLDVSGIEVHVSNYRTDARDAAHVIRAMADALAARDAEIARLRAALAWAQHRMPEWHASARAALSPPPASDGGEA